MTDQQEFDRLMKAYFVPGTNELADRVLDAALDEIDHTHQRRPLRASWRFSAMTMPTRIAAAAVIGVLAVGGAYLLTQPGKPAVGVPGPTSTPTPTAAASRAATTARPTPTPTSTPDIPALTGPLGDGRQIHTATTLADGRVLVVGGFGNKDNPLASAVVYDPKSNAFSPTGSLATPRGFQTSTLLADGRVLVTGGGPAAWVNDDPYLATAELYDPATGVFSPTASMIVARENHTATRLKDGRVLIAGGNDLRDHATASAELYDPATGTFSATGSMGTARGYHTATLLADGRVLITGGDPANNNFAYVISLAEIYDPGTGTFSPTGSLVTARAFHAAVLLTDGRVLISGGLGNTADLASAELFDPRTGRFTETGPMTVPRVYQPATLLGDGRVLIAGGGGDYENRAFTASAELYDPRTGVFTATGSMTAARTWFPANLLADGHVLVTGGYGVLAPLPSAELYDPTAGTFSSAGGS